MGKKPAAVYWYDVYCYLFSCLNFWTAWHGWGFAHDPYGLINAVPYLSNMATDQASTDAVVLMIRTMGWSLFAMGLFFGGAAFTLPFAPATKKSWTAHLLHLVFGMSSCVMLPICLPVLIAWFKPQVKAYFGVEGRKP